MVCAIEPSKPFREQTATLIEESKALISHYKQIEADTYSDIKSLSDQARLERLTLRRNIILREAWVTWAEEVLADLESQA
jgi:PadR family transcriptional regulator AphA